MRERVIVRTLMLRCFLPRCFVVCAFTAFGTATPESALAPTPLKLEDFFLGHLSGSGTTQDIEHGSRSLNLSGVGARIPGGIRLSIDTSFSDGERKRVEWTFVRDGHGGYVGHRRDLVGDAEVTQVGNEVAMSYHAKIASAGGAKTLGFDEHFTLESPNTMVDRLSAKFLFVDVASADITIRKSK